MRATQHFHCGLLLGTTQKPIFFRETHWNIFGVFIFFLKKANWRERKTKMRKTIYTGKLPTNKRRNEKSFWVFFYYYKLTKQERKTKNKREIFLDFRSFSNTQEENGNKTNMDIQWKRMNTNNLNECVLHECNIGEKYILPQA